MNHNQNKCCRPRNKCCCPFPKSLLAPSKKEPAPEVMKLKNYLALPFPEDDV